MVFSVKREEEVYWQLKQQGLGDVYEHPGIYQICIDGYVVYIGKSKNMLRRLAQHYVGIQNKCTHKYRIMAEAKRQNHAVTFGVLYYAEAQTNAELVEELGQKEGELIRQIRPALNTQIPKADNWRKYDIDKTVKTISLSQIIQQQNQQIQTKQFLDTIQQRTRSVLYDSYK